MQKTSGIKKQQSSVKTKLHGKHPNLYWKTFDREKLLKMFKDRYIQLEQISDEEIVEIKNSFTSGVEDQDKKDEILREKKIEIDALISKRVRQRTTPWLDIKYQLGQTNDIRINSSEIATILGFHSPYAQKYVKKYAYAKDYSDIFQTSLFLGPKRKKFDKLTTMRMNWGTNHEDNMVLQMMVDFPSFRFYEAGCNIIKRTDEFPYSIIVSPDLYFESMKDKNIKGTVEINCPFPHYELKDEKDDRLDEYEDKSDVYSYSKNSPEPKKGSYKDPVVWYYLLQVHFQMESSGNDNGYFCVWTPSGGVKYVHVQKDPELIRKAKHCLKYFVENYVLNGRKITSEDLKKNPYENYYPYKELLNRIKELLDPKHYVKALKENIDVSLMPPRSDGLHKNVYHPDDYVEDEMSEESQ